MGCEAKNVQWEMNKRSDASGLASGCHKVFMSDSNENGSDARVLALEKREADIRAKLAAARELKRKREAAFRKSVAAIIGGALLDADIPPDLKSSISQILMAAGLEDRAIRLLRQGGWLL
jgi:hypothetical protein